MQEYGGSFRFSGSWQESFLREAGLLSGTAAVRRPLSIKGFYSDLLYQPWYCATTELRDEWLQRDTIPRRAASGLTLEQFHAEFEVPNRPVIITGLVRGSTHIMTVHPAGCGYKWRISTTMLDPESFKFHALRY